MSKQPLISVIVPTYNHEDFVIQALDSVHQQTYANIELLVIDDCSKDATFERSMEWGDAKKDRFTACKIWRNAENMGAHNTINSGLDMASGDYIAILNSDDWYAPERFEKMLCELEVQGCNYAFSNVKVVDGKGLTIKHDSFAIDCMTLEDQLSAYPSIGFAMLKKNIAVTTGNIFITRKMQQKVGKFANLKLTHDWDFLLRCLALEEPVYVPGDLYYYRVYKGNSFNKLRDEMYFEAQILLKKYFNNIENKKYENVKYPIYIGHNNMENVNLVKIYLVNEGMRYNSIFKIYKEFEQKNSI